MTRLRPLIALFTALTLLFALPAAGAEAKHPAAKRHQKAKKHKKRCKATKAKRGKKGKKARKHAKKRCAKKPGAAGQTTPGANGTDDVGHDEPVNEAGGTAKRIGQISAVDGSTITVALDKGGSITGAVTEDTDLMCASSIAAADEDDDGPVGAPDDGDDWDDDPADDDGADADDDAGDDDDPADDDGELRSARQASTASVCHPAVGDPVYDAELDDFSDSPVFATLDLYGA